MRVAQCAHGIVPLRVRTVPKDVGRLFHAFFNGFISAFWDHRSPSMSRMLPLMYCTELVANLMERP